MTDQRNATTPKTGRRIPPLVWIVLALLVGWFVIMMVQRNGQDVTPQGGTHPTQAEGPSIMPAAPANGDAPATPAGVVNGPNQPAPDKP
ncbi:hypothetical protein [Phenylobacterium sp.]|jgi:hypothetical protein|uniref:hypothetical protein n=1 Tax=Phenylobacterium sp. TaxID=1871053 RepID=UPI002F95CA60